MNNKKGFTLVELLAVIVVLAILIMIASAGVVSAINRANDRQAKIHENNLLESALTYVVLARRVCPNGYGTDAMTLEKCITAKCPSDFIQKNGDRYRVNSKYSTTSATYKNCSITILASDIIDGIGVAKRADSLDTDDEELYEQANDYCERNGQILVYKDQYGSLEGISLTENICRK